MFSRNFSEAYKKGLYFMSELYERIEQLCKSRNINITTMCKESGASRSSLTDLKSGRKQNLSVDTLSKISSYFCVSVDYLAGKDEDARTLENAREELSNSIGADPSMPSGKRLDMLFNASGYDHVVVCFNLGIEQRYLDNWMKNNELPPKPIIDKILGVFRMKPEDLLAGIELKEYSEQTGEWGASTEKASTPESESGRHVNVVTIAGRDGNYKEKRLTDEQIKALQTIIDQMPEAPDDL